MSIGITLNLNVSGEPGFDVLISSGFCCGWCHWNHRESLFLVVVANLYYCKCAVIKKEVLEYYTIIPYILYRTNDDKSVPAADLLPNFLKFPHMTSKYLFYKITKLYTESQFYVSIY